jgi:hypothetical protein
MTFFRQRNAQPLGERGSLKWIQHLVGNHPDTLTSAIAAATNRPSTWSVEWVSPLPSDEWAEYRDAQFLLKLGRPELIADLESFWPSGGPQWDALGKSTDNGVVLVEAKAHFAELTSKCGAGDESVTKIKATLNATKPQFGAREDTDWLQPYYQYSNRLAHLKFFATRGIPALLVFVYFYGDTGMPGPKSAHEWKASLESVHRHLGFSGDLSQSGVVNLFISVPALESAF